MHLRKYRVLIIHGPNLNLLGERDVAVYGKLSLLQVNRKIRSYASSLNIQARIFQSNSEGEIIDRIHLSRKWADGIVINPAAYTHYSYAIRDAIESVQIPTVEVHLSDIKKREKFRRKSVISAVCKRQISGLGLESYLQGIQFLSNL